MSTLRLIPDIEKIVSDHLRDQLEAELPDLDCRVVGKTPDDHVRPWVRVTKLDGDPRDVADHHIGYMVQLDCYAGADRQVSGRGDHWGGQPEANLLSRTVRALVVDIADFDHEGAVLTGGRIVGDHRAPDRDIGTPARERVILTAEIWGHAAPEGS